MASTLDFIEYVYGQIEPQWEIRFRKMFGDYMIYVNDKPLLLVCDNTVYVKKLDILDSRIQPDSTGTPYNGAKEHYVLDPEDTELLNSVIKILEKVIPVPVKKAKKSAEK
jgi:TfoX/Sxy family transcriptional regulator of competence genes